MQKIFFFFVLFSGLILADNVYLTNGESYKNVITEKHDEVSIKVIFPNKKNTYMRVYYKDIDRIEYDNGNIFRAVDPCNDKVLVSLQKKDSMTVDEMRIYVELTKQCNEYQNNLKLEKNRNELLETVNDSSNRVSGVLVASLVLSIIGAIVYFVKIN